MTELEQKQLNEMLNSYVMKKAFQTAITNKKKYDVDVHQKESFIIYEPDWSIYYDLNAGFKLDIKEDTFMCL